MNNIITLSQLITRLAKATGVDNNTARLFLRTFFVTIEESLEKGENVVIKNIGEFRLADDASGRRRLGFVPAEVISEEINKPFEMFEAVELAPDVDFSEVDSQEKKQEPNVVEVETAPHDPEVVETVVVSEPEVVQPVPESQPESEPEPEPEPEPVRDTAEAVAPSVPFAANVTEEEDGPVYHFADDDEEEEEAPYERPQSRRREQHSRRSYVWVWCLLFIVLVAAGAYYAAVRTVPIPDLFDDEEEIVTTEEPEVKVNIEEVDISELGTTQEAAAPETSSPKNDKTAEKQLQKQVEQPTAAAASKPGAAREPVYDTVQVSLIRLAIKHYHVPEYWVFIFDANADKIKNPNRISPGTRVVIPDQSTFPGSSKAETKAIAKRKQAEYNKRFD